VYWRWTPARCLSIGMALIVLACSVQSQQPLFDSPESRPASAPAESGAQPPRWEPLLLDLARHVSSAFSEQGIRSWVEIKKVIRMEDRLTVQVNPLGTLQLPREAWASFLEKLLPRETGVWIDDASFVIPGPTGRWTLKTLVVSTPACARPAPPSDLDGTRLQEWLSLVQACAADVKGSEFLVKWRRTDDSRFRFEASTASHKAASKLCDRLKDLLTGRGSEARLKFFEDKTQASIVVVSGEDFALPDSRPATTTRPR
jgi:hypothetical protein